MKETIVESENVYSYGDIVARMCDAIETLSAEELEDVANEKFGMNIRYIGDSMFEEIPDETE